MPAAARSLVFAAIVLLAAAPPAQATDGRPPANDPRAVSPADYTAALRVELERRYGDDYRAAPTKYALCPELTANYDGELDTYRQDCEFEFGSARSRRVGGVTFEVDPEGDRTLKLSARALTLRSQQCRRPAAVGAPPQWHLTYLRVQSMPGGCDGPARLIGDALYGNGGPRRSLPNKLTTWVTGTGVGAHPSIYRYRCTRVSKRMRCANRVGHRFSFWAVRR